VLGCRGEAGLTRRLDLGIHLYLAGAAPLLLLSGGGTGPVPEAELMRRMALARGVPDTALLVEPNSRDTVENANEAARLLRVRWWQGRAGQRSLPPAEGRAGVPSRGSARRGLGRGTAALDQLGDRRRNPRVCGAAEKLGAGAPPPRPCRSLIGHAN